MKAIDASEAMVIVLSASANRSKQVMREVSQAAERGVPLVPVRIAELRPTGRMAYFLDSYHWLDAFPGPVQPHLPRLVTALAEVTGREVADPPPASPPQDEFIEVHPDQLTIDPRRRWSARFWGLFADK